MNKDTFKLALCFGLLAMFGITVGHYWDWWEMAYPTCSIGALIIAAVFVEK